jgi:flagellar hook assembly protein FlgD
VNTLSGVGGSPESYVLSVSNYPNPFNPRTTVSYTVPARGHVTVAIYDARGARVATLVNEDRDAGAYRVDWDGRADNGATVSSGVYFARIEQAGATRSKKMVLLK